jgi:hypothetical protein
MAKKNQVFHAPIFNGVFADRGEDLREFPLDLGLALFKSGDRRKAVKLCVGHAHLEGTTNVGELVQLITEAIHLVLVLDRDHER